MHKLDLAVGIADAVVEAEQQAEPVDIGSLADDLLLAHPNTGVSKEDVVEALEDQVVPVAPI